MTDQISRVEAPVTMKAYFLCAFAAFGGILFGYDSGYISSCLGMDFFKYQFGSEVPANYDPTSYEMDGTFYMYKTWEKSLITSILSAGTFLGALSAGNFADWIGRRTTIILGCLIFSVGVVLQVAATIVGLLVAGRFIAGLGVGFVSAIIILYMSEIAPKGVRGTVSSLPCCVVLHTTLMPSSSEGYLAKECLLNHPRSLLVIALPSQWGFFWRQSSATQLRTGLIRARKFVAPMDIDSG